MDKILGTEGVTVLLPVSYDVPDKITIKWFTQLQAIVNYQLRSTDLVNYVYIRI